MADCVFPVNKLDGEDVTGRREGSGFLDTGVYFSSCGGAMDGDENEPCVCALSNRFRDDSEW